MKKRTILFSIVFSSLLLIASLVGCQSQAEPPEGATSQWYYDQGCQLCNSGRYDEAIDYLDKAIELDPNFAEAYGARGIVYLNTSDYDEAIIDFDECIRLNPQYSDSIFAHDRQCANLALIWKSEGVGTEVSFREYSVTIDSSSYLFVGVLLEVIAGTIGDEIKENLIYERVRSEFPVLAIYNGLVIYLSESVKKVGLTSSQYRYQIISYSDVEIPDIVIQQLQQLVPEQ
jgi:tetratricopeptide (TPR) repeat protein